ncbi:MAG: TfoX/Sxy family protein [Gammaproteobacteria bacterium]|nr:TfoX/Sxy family protein [Gammaproteobacteria bacterium]
MSDFTDFLAEVFADLGPIRARRMFGGYGIYIDGLMFALVADDTLYLKTDKASSIRFEEKGLTPFEYMKNGKPVKMSYYLAPEEIYEDPDIALEWGKLAIDAALRSNKKNA